MALVNVMLDLETLGTRPGCAILAIGAVRFGPELANGTQNPFYQVVSTPSCTHHYGLHIDPATLRWWEMQRSEARDVIKEAKACKIGLKTALANFTDYLAGMGGVDSISLWGNGSDFDISILAACYHACDMPLPWRFWNNRCFRTLRNLAGMKKKPAALVKHHALEDAVDQAVEAVEILKKIRFNEQASLAL